MSICFKDRTWVFWGFSVPTVVCSSYLAVPLVLLREWEGTGEFLSNSGKYQGLYLEDTEASNVGQAREESLDKDTEIFLSLFSVALTK